jgi:putative hydrolase of the HAD superfamily
LLAVPFPVSAVLFDLDNTLFDRDAAFRAWATACIRPWFDGTTGEWAEALECLIALDNHGVGAKPAMFAALKDAYPTLRLSAEELLVAFHTQLRLYGTLDAGTRHLLAVLRTADLPFGIVTNGSEHQLHKIQTLGLDVLTSCIFVSALCNCRKPEAAIFLAAASSLTVPPAEILFVGDNPEADIQGAHRVGMRTAWLCRDQRWPTHLPPSCADLIIEALDDLIAPPSRRGEGEPCQSKG